MIISLIDLLDKLKIEAFWCEKNYGVLDCKIPYAKGFSLLSEEFTGLVSFKF